MTDFTALRARFPLLAERTYLATQCLGPCPAQVRDDLDDYQRTLHLRSRGLPRWIERIDEMMALAERLLHAPADSVALMPSATAAQAAIAAAVTPRGARTRILHTAIDFHSSRYLWGAQRARGFEVVCVPDAAEGSVGDATGGSTEGSTGGSTGGSTEGSTGGFPIASLVAQIDARTAVVALSLVSPLTAALADLELVIAAAHRAGAIVVVDAYQALGVVPIDVQALGVDVLVGGTHKWLCGGGTGLVFLYVRPELAERIEPGYPGWIGHHDRLGFSPSYVPARGARRFMQGTPAVEPIYTARAGLRFVLEAGVGAIRARNLALTSRVIERADAHGIAVRTPRAPGARGGTVCLDVAEPARIVEALAAQGIDVDARPEAGVRVAPHACNTEAECDHAIDAIARELGR